MGIAFTFSQEARDFISKNGGDLSHCVCHNFVPQLRFMRRCRRRHQ